PPILGGQGILFETLDQRFAVLAAEGHFFRTFHRTLSSCDSVRHIPANGFRPETAKLIAGGTHTSEGGGKCPQPQVFGISRRVVGQFEMKSSVPAFRGVVQSSPGSDMLPLCLSVQARQTPFVTSTSLPLVL